jgi:hypothetical protein
LFYVNPTLVISSRIYGNLLPDDVTTFCNTIKEKIGPGKCWLSRKPAKMPVKEEAANMFLDYDYFGFQRLRGSKEVIKIENGLCLNCGSPLTKNSYNGCCDKCFFYCSGCDKYHYLKKGETSYKAKGRFYCHTCYDKIFKTCGCCGKKTMNYTYVYESNGSNKEPSKVVYCNDCAGSHTKYCSFCNNYFVKGKEDIVIEIFRLNISNKRRFLEQENFVIYKEKHFTCPTCSKWLNEKATYTCMKCNKKYGAPVLDEGVKICNSCKDDIRRNYNKVIGKDLIEFKWKGEKTTLDEIKV